MRAEASEKRRMLVENPLGQPRPRERATRGPLPVLTRGWVLPGSRRFQAHQWRRYAEEKRSGASQARGGRIVQRPGPGAPRRGCLRELPREGSDLAGVGTRREGPSQAEERGSQRRVGRELLHHGRGRQRPRKNGRRRDRLWGRSRWEKGEPAAPREQHRERGAVETQQGHRGGSDEATWPGWRACR